jgi:CHAD domain-containing protein
MQEALRAILVRQAGLLFSYEEKILADPDTESVHDMRVAARRLRAVLRIFRNTFEPERLKEWVTTLSRAIRALGRVRDCDIVIRNLESLRPLLTNDSHASLDELLRDQVALRDGHAEALRTTVRGMRTSGAAAGFTGFVESSMLRPTAPGPSLRETAAVLLPRLLKEAAAYRREVVGHPERTEVLHEMRIDARPLRYLMEAFEPAFGKAFSKRLRELKDFLDVAGEVHDCDVMIAMLSGQIGAKRAGAARSAPGAGLVRDVKIAKILATQQAIRRRKFKRLQEEFGILAREKFRKKLVRSVE